MHENGYTRMHPVGMRVPAEMLETIAGYPDEEQLDRELAFAIGMIDWKNADTLRWLGALLSMKVDYIDIESGAV